MNKHPIKKIVIIGPESTGKSTLCSLLADHYKTTWCPEYAREYLNENGPKYQYEDLLQIAKGQIHLETVYEQKLEAMQAANPYLFIDTNLYVMKVWSEYVFNKCHHYILDEIARRPYDLYLLCNIDLPWVEDELREYPDLEKREELFRLYHDLMINQQVPCVIIEGDYNQRLNAATRAIDSLFPAG